MISAQSDRVLSADACAATIERWVAAELAAWQGSTLDRAAIERRLRIDADRNAYICLFRLENGSVDFDPSVAIYRPQFLESTNQDGYRALAYRGMLRDAVAMYGVCGTALIGVYLADLYAPDLVGPVMFFQKPLGARGILLPDIDFLITQYCLDEANGFYDPLAYDDKAAQAVFVGSTTGDDLTARHVTEGLNARLRSAVFFRERDDVIFDLPNIVQYDTIETRRMIEALDVSGMPRDWTDQQAFRYLLSLDGNGATCSRVALALHSRSLLLKYASPNMLYYFHGLEPWRHYVPIVTDQDVVEVLADATAFDGLHRRIATDSRTFAQTFLTRRPILRYMATLLADYVAVFGEGGEPLDPLPAIPLIDTAAHVANVGRMWTWPGAWSGDGLNAIEGLTLVPDGGVPADMLQYRAVMADGSETRVARGREFCGSKGRSIALHGLAVRLTGESAGRYALRGRARHRDGTERDCVTSWSPSAHVAPITGFRLELIPRG